MLLRHGGTGHAYAPHAKGFAVDLERVAIYRQSGLAGQGQGKKQQQCAGDDTYLAYVFHIYSHIGFTIILLTAIQ